MHEIIFWSHIISLYFVAGGEVCPGVSTAALAAKGPRSDSFPPGDAIPLFLRGERSLLLKLLPAGKGL